MVEPLRVRAGRLLSLAGGGLFAVALGVGLWRYAQAFGEPPASWSPAGWPVVAANSAWFTFFALHHSVFARTRVRAWVARLVGAPFERTVYVWVASLLFLGTAVFWQPVPGVAWAVRGAPALLLHALQVGGVVLTGYASLQLGVLELAGIPQAFGRRRVRTGEVTTSGAYAVVRHPIYFAWLLMVWPAPVMTGSRLLFAVLSTAYLVLAVPLEERTLRRDFGPPYEDYQRRVRWRMLPWVY